MGNPLPQILLLRQYVFTRSISVLPVKKQVIYSVFQMCKVQFTFISDNNVDYFISSVYNNQVSMLFCTFCLMKAVVFNNLLPFRVHFLCQGCCIFTTIFLFKGITLSVICFCNYICSWRVDKRSSVCYNWASNPVVISTLR